MADLQNGDAVKLGSPAAMAYEHPDGDDYAQRFQDYYDDMNAPTDPETAAAQPEQQVYRKVHHLKTWPEYFAAIRENRKPFEIRENDRDYQVGDLLVLMEYDPVKDDFSGEEENRVVTYLTDWGQPSGQVVLGIVTPTPRTDLETLRADNERLKRKEYDTVHDFCARVLERLNERGIDTSNCDGDGSLEEILSSWIQGQIEEAKEESELAQLREANAQLARELKQDGAEWAEDYQRASDRAAELLKETIQLTRERDAVLKERDEARAERSLALANLSNADDKIEELQSYIRGYQLADAEPRQITEALITAANALAKRCREMVEHIGYCDERKLLACDDDKHPPSVFSVYAEEMKADLAQFDALRKGDK